MITVACVNWRDYLGHGKQYVETLRAMVARNLHQPFHFECIEEAGDLYEWWVKVALFQPGRFKGRVLYLDLDTVVTNSLDELVETKGIIDEHAWGHEGRSFNSSVMVWDAGEHEEIFTQFTPTVARKYCVGGDQEWITSLGGWTPFHPHLCKSYKRHSVVYPPDGCAVVAFHGHPKPHELLMGWVPQYWSVQ